MDLSGNQVAVDKPLMLDEAKEIIYGQRQQEYGGVSDNFTRIANGWSEILGARVTAEQVALCMIWVKMSRLVKTPSHRDSKVDIAGYIGCMDKLERGE